MKNKKIDLIISNKFPSKKEPNKNHYIKNFVEVYSQINNVIFIYTNTLTGLLKDKYIESFEENNLSYNFQYLKNIDKNKNKLNNFVIEYTEKIILDKNINIDDINSIICVDLACIDSALHFSKKYNKKIKIYLTDDFFEEEITKLNYIEKLSIRKKLNKTEVIFITEEYFKNSLKIEKIKTPIFTVGKTIGNTIQKTQEFPKKIYNNYLYIYDNQSEKNNLYLLLSAIKEISLINHNISITILQLNEDHSIENYAESIELENKNFFIQKINNIQESYNFYLYSDFYISLDTNESLSYHTLLSLSMNIPVICFRKPKGIIEIFDNYSLFYDDITKENLLNSIKDSKLYLDKIDFLKLEQKYQENYSNNELYSRLIEISKILDN